MSFAANVYTLCHLCDHFVEKNYSEVEVGLVPEYANLAEYEHLDNGQKDHDHDAYPSDLSASLVVWQAIRPDLFIIWSDAIGPNSKYHHPPEQRLGLNEREARLARIAAVYPLAADEAR